MATLILPDPIDAKDIIIDCLTMLPKSANITETRREQIVSNCVTPFVNLIQAAEIASAAGLEEEEVFLQFLGVLFAQSQAHKRAEQLRCLMAKLQIYIH